MTLTILHRARLIIEKADKGGAVWLPVRAVLLLCSWIYGAGVLARRSLYLHVPGFRRQVRAYVVSVGNITVGGAGKTPTVEMCARLWLRNGKKVAIVSRGYGKAKLSERQTAPPGGIRIVSDGRGHILLSSDEAGDEPYLLAKRLPDAVVLVSSDRVAACEFAVRQFGAEVIILDDAFQHLRLYRDEDVVAIDATNPFGNGHLLPRGILREPLSSLRRATRILITKRLPANARSGSAGTETDTDRGNLKATLQRVAPGVPVSWTRYVPTHLSVPSGEETLPLSYLRDKKVAVFCGIADPDFFERTLTNLGAHILLMKRFPDHQSYTLSDIVSIDKDACENNADAIVTTEKDLVRLPHDILTRCPLYAVAVEINIDDEPAAN